MPTGDSGVVGQVLGTLFRRAREKADEQQAKFDQQRNADIQMYEKVLLDPATSPESREKATKEINKLRNLKPAESPYNKLTGLLNHLGSKLQGRGGQQQGLPPLDPSIMQGEQSSQETLPKGIGGMLTPDQRQAGTSGGAAQQPEEIPQSAQPPALNPAQQSVSHRALTKVSRGLGKMLTGLGSGMEMIMPQGQQMSTIPEMDATAFQAGVGSLRRGVVTDTFDTPGEALEGQVDVMGNPTEKGKTYRGMHDAMGNFTGWIPSAPKSSGYMRILGPMSMSEAKKFAGMGTQFKDADGNTIDVSKYDDSMQLVAVRQGDKTFYQPTSQGIAHITVGNEVYTVPKLDEMNLAGAGQAQGIARVPSTGYQWGMGPDNQPALMAVPRVPSTPGLQPGPAPAGMTPQAPVAAPQSGAPSAPPQAPQQKRNLTHPSAHPSGNASIPPAPAGASHTAVRPIPLSVYNRQQPNVTAIKNAAAQLFGDPSQPDFKSLADYGYLMNDPAAVARIGTAARLLIGDLAIQEKGHAGGLMTLIETAGGLPQAIGAAQTQATTDAIGRLKPDEKYLLDALIDAYGDVIGLRAITKASSSQFSAKALEREVPFPGYSATDSRQFYDKLSRLAEKVWTAAQLQTDVVLGPEYKKFYKQKYDELLRKSREAPKSQMQTLTNPNTGVQAPVYTISH